MFLLNLFQLLKWSGALPLYEDIAVILIYREALLPLVSHTVFAFQKGKKEKTKALPLALTDFTRETSLVGHACGSPSGNAAFTLPLRLSVVKREWVCLLCFMKWNTSFLPNGVRLVFISVSACSCGSELKLRVFCAPQCTGGVVIFSPFVPGSISASLGLVISRGCYVKNNCDSRVFLQNRPTRRAGFIWCWYNNSPPPVKTMSDRYWLCFYWYNKLENCAGLNCRLPCGFHDDGFPRGFRVAQFPSPAEMWVLDIPLCDVSIQYQCTKYCFWCLYCNKKLY